MQEAIQKGKVMSEVDIQCVIKKNYHLSIWRYDGDKEISAYSKDLRPKEKASHQYFLQLFPGPDECIYGLFQFRS